VIRFLKTKAPALGQEERRKQMKTEECNVNASAIILSFLFGGLVGAGVALLMAPKPGKETREKIKELAEDAKEKAETLVDQVKGKAEVIVDQVKDTVNTAVGKGRNYIEEQKSILASAVEAGKEAYEKEKEKLIPSPSSETR
jgi:gas vesicle protein